MANTPTPRRPTSGTQPRADRTRQAVIDETVRYILDEGFVAPSVRRITERAGLTWGVVQYHFGDLSGLLMAVVEQGIRQLTDVTEQLPARTVGLTVRERNQAVVDAVWPAFSSPTSMAALEILICTRRTRAHAMNSALADVQQRFTALGVHLGAGLDTTHATEIGNLIWTTLRGIVVAQMISPVPLNSARDRAALVEVLTTYVTANERGGP